MTGQPLGNFCRKCDGFIKYDDIIVGSVDEPGLCPFIRFPITGITHAQAVDFCKWRTKIIGNNKIEFRLPTAEEWKKFAIKGLSSIEKSNGYRDSMPTNGCPSFNYKYITPCDRFITTGLAVPRQIGIVRFMMEKTSAFDVFGNVSEMKNIPSVAEGGNYRIYASQGNVDSIQLYNKPEVWLGFRCTGIRK